jgi:hypothetical protein
MTCEERAYLSRCAACTAVLAPTPCPEQSTTALLQCMWPRQQHTTALYPPIDVLLSLVSPLMSM